MFKIYSFFLLYRLERNRSKNNNTWVDEVKNDLCQVLSTRKQLVVIFEFESQRHHGNLEDAILEALFNGLYFSLDHLNNTYSIICLATKFSGDNLDEQQCRVAELKLAIVFDILLEKMFLIILIFLFIF